MTEKIRPNIADTSALRAFAIPRNVGQAVYESIPMSTPDVCFEEVKRNESMASYSGAQIWKNVLSYRQLDDDDLPDWNPNVLHTSVEYQAYVDDQGEQAIADLIRRHPDDVDVVYMYNDKDLGILRDAADEVGASVSFNYPSKAFDLLHERDVITRGELTEALNEIIEEEGWTARVFLQDTKVDPDDL